jgi:hypothetical protein
MRMVMTVIHTSSHTSILKWHRNPNHVDGRSMNVNKKSKSLVHLNIHANKYKHFAELLSSTSSPRKALVMRRHMIWLIWSCRLGDCWSECQPWWCRGERDAPRTHRHMDHLCLSFELFITIFVEITF